VAVAAECHSRYGFQFQPKLSVDFAGGEITGDAGLVLVREFDERLGLTKRLGWIIEDDRDRRYVRHDVVDLVRQRIYQIVSGYEDANDATFLRRDPALRAVVHRDAAELASQPTLSRLENAAPWESIRRLELEGANWFCRHGGPRRRRSGEEIVLDMDSTDDPTHGQQQLAFYSGFYDTYMYHPLLVFEGDSGTLLASRLRPGDVGGTRGLLALLRPLVSKLRGRFPRRPIALRGDGDFSKPNLLEFADYSGCSYAFGMPRNPVLERHVEKLRERAERLFQGSGERVRLYKSFFHKTRSWSLPRRILAKVERTSEGHNLRFVVTNRDGSAEEIFTWYEQRGRAENFIKDFKRDLCADRLSCSSFRANAFRLQLHALAYNLLLFFRRVVLRGTELANSTLGELRLRLLKIGARVRSSWRRLWFHLASGWPGRPLFLHVLDRLESIHAPAG
jgi:hypothetical protein